MNTFPRPVSAILFDLDGVLVDTAHAHFQAWSRLAGQLGLPFDAVANEQLKGVCREESLDLLLGSQASSVSAAEKRRLAALKNDWYREMISQLGPADLFPGARCVLEAARAAGVRTGLTSASRNARFLVGRLDIDELLDTVVDGGAIAQGKPAPEIYLRGASDLAVPPLHCLGVEDAVAGIASIAAAGMASVGVGSRCHLADADAVIGAIAEFRLSDYRIESAR